VKDEICLFFLKKEAIDSILLYNIHSVLFDAIFSIGHLYDIQWRLYQFREMSKEANSSKFFPRNV